MEDYDILSSGVHNDNNGAHFVLEAVQNNKQIGYIQANINSNKNCIECTTAIEKEYRNRGIATKLLDNMLRDIFIYGQMDEACNLLGYGTETQRMILSIDIDNLASRRVAEKLGFTVIDSESRDSVEYELTKQAYIQSQEEREALAK